MSLQARLRSIEESSLLLQRQCCLKGLQDVGMDDQQRFGIVVDTHQVADLGTRE